jgi:hypothetical protein
MVVNYLDARAQWNPAPKVEPWPDVEPEYIPIPSRLVVREPPPVAFTIAATAPMALFAFFGLYRAIVMALGH